MSNSLHVRNAPGVGQIKLKITQPKTLMKQRFFEKIHPLGTRIAPWYNYLALKRDKPNDEPRHKPKTEPA